MTDILKLFFAATITLYYTELKWNKAEGATIPKVFMFHIVYVHLAFCLVNAW